MLRFLQKGISLSILLLTTATIVALAQPTITFSPAGGTANVSENTAIVITSNQTLRRDSDNNALTDGNVSSVVVLKQGSSSGANIAFTATINAADDQITITPTAALPSNTVIYVAITNVESTGVGGGALSPDPTFITFTVRDYSAPTVTFSPLNGATNVNISTAITITFDKPVRKLDDSAIANADLAGLLTFKTPDGTGSNVDYTATINAAKTVITITPNSSLTNNTDYYVALAPVEGSNDVATAATNITFKTTADTQAPVPTFNPADGSIDAVNANPITITFNEAIRDINNAALTNASIDGKITLKVTDNSGANIPFDATIDGTNTIVTITPSSTLADFTVVYVAVNNVEDQFDNAITTAQTATFTTGDGTAPTITFNPANGATGVNVTSNIVITFNEAIRNINNSEITDANAGSLVTFKLTNSSGGNVAFTATIDAGKTSITVNPDADLNPNQVYYLSIAPVENSYNLPTSASNITFTTPDTQVPIATFNPVNGATNVSNTGNITITFNEPIRNLDNSALDDTSIDGKITLKLTNNSGLDIPFNATINVAKTIITIDPTLALPDLSTIYVAFNNVEDASDNQITTAQSITFSTSDITPPAMTFDPANGSTSFTVTANLTITFNEAIRLTNDNTITDTNVDGLITFKVTNSSGSNVGFNATIDIDKKVITINPDNNLQANQTYYLAIAAVEDSYNNATVLTSITFQTQELTANAGPNADACTGQPTKLSGSATGGNGFYKYAWTGPNGFSSSAASPNVVPTTAGANVYTLVVTDSDGNSDDATVTITVNASPTNIDFIASGTDAAFRNQFIVTESPYELAAAGTPAGGTFVWSGLGVSLGNAGKYYFAPAIAGTGNNPITISCSYTLSGCSITETQQVNVNTSNSIVNNLAADYCSRDGLTVALTHNSSVFWYPAVPYSRMRLGVYSQAKVDYYQYLDVLVGSAEYNAMFEEVAGSNPKTYRLNPSAIPNLAGNPAAGVAGLYTIIVFGHDGISEYYQGEAQFYIKDSPTAPITGALPNFCVSDVIGDYRVSLRAGGTLTWYQNAGPTSPIAPGDIADPYFPKFSELGLGENFSGTFTRYLTQTVDGCESAVATVNIVVNNNPAPPTIPDPDPICSGEAVPDLTASGSPLATIYAWYGAAGPGTPDLNQVYYTGNFVNSAELAVPSTVTSTTTFERFVSQYVNGCESPKASVDIIVRQTPIAPLASSPTYCLNETIAPIQVTTSGSVAVRWYTDELRTSQITPINNPENATAAELSLSSATPAVYSRFVTQTLAGCESTPRNVVITINGLPGVSITASQPLAAICKSGELIKLFAKPEDPQNGGGWSGAAAPGLSNIDLAAGTAELSPASALFLPGQSYSLTYTYVDNTTSCSNSVTATMTFLPSITPSIIVGDACDGQFVNITNSSSIVPPAATSTIELFAWNFGDGDLIDFGSGAIPSGANGGNTEGNYNDLKHKFSGPIGTKALKYRMITSDGCLVEGQEQVEINPIPVADFTWAEVCEGNPTLFAASTSNVPAIPNSNIAYTWTFNREGSLTHGTPVLSPNGHQASVVYTSIGRDTVQMVATTNNNCTDIVKKPVFIVPKYAAINETNAYTQDFESGTDGWIDGGSRSSWSFGTPDPTSLFTSKGQLWATSLTPLQRYNPNEQSWILSRCFDFSQSVKPVISLDVRADTPGGIDGAVLQYNTSGNIEDETEWKVLGVVNQGINWYQQQGIASNPGSQSQSDYGWSGSADDSRYTEWKRAIYKLDELVGQNEVVFRIAFASTNAATRQGFAFDNIFIGERSRIVLVENFTNSSATGTSTHNDYFKNFNASGEVVKIQYHTSFPGNDPVHGLNSSLNDARSAFYGLNTSLTLRVDGDYKSGTVSNWADAIYNNRVLTPSPVKITFTGVNEIDDVVRINLSIQNTTLENLDLSDAHLFAAVLEKRITDTELLAGSGNSEFVYVAREFLPGPAGIKIARILAPGETVTIPEILWKQSNLIDVNEGAIVAFIQSTTGNREVHQSAIYNNTTPVPRVATGVENPSFAKQVLVYPNPSIDEVNVVLPESSNLATPIRLTDSFGRDIAMDVFKAGERSKKFSTKDISAGVYFIQLQTSNGLVVKKLVVSH